MVLGRAAILKSLSQTTNPRRASRLVPLHFQRPTLFLVPSQLLEYDAQQKSDMLVHLVLLDGQLEVDLVS
jgi:hypothetical protein